MPERLVLALGSTLAAFVSPRRADLIALCSETTTPTSLLRSLRDGMLMSPTGRQILRDRPRISSRTVDLPYLRTLPADSVGRNYVDWLDRERLTPDSRDPVRHVADEELAYVLQRYRESHDLYHVLLAERGMPSFLEGEVIVKGFEFAALGLPMTGMAALSAFKLPGEQRRRVLWGGRGGAGDTTADTDEASRPRSLADDSDEMPARRAQDGEPWLLWAVRQGVATRSSPAGGLMNVYWEREWETPIAELREQRLCIRLPAGVGDLRRIRRGEKRGRAKARAER